MKQPKIEISHGGKMCLLRRGYLSEKTEVNRVEIKARFETGKFRLIISEKVQKDLELEIIDRRRLIRANDEEFLADVAEFVELRIENRSITVEPFVLPEISGAILGKSFSDNLKMPIYLK
jgi:hypothetical protein